MDIQKPSDWGISHKDSWVSFEELKDNGAPALEGRDVVSFAAGQMKQQPAHDNRKQAAMVRRCDPGFHADGNKCVPEGSVRPPTAAPSKRLGSSLRKFERDKAKKDAIQKPQQQEQEQQARSDSPEPQKEKTIPPKESSPERPIGKNFNVELTESNEEYLDKIKKEGKWNGTEFVDLRKIVGDQTSIPPRHLDALSRMLVTSGSDKLGWSYIGGEVPGGAGKIYAQAGELMTLTLTGLPEEQSKKLEQIISNTLKEQKERKTKNQVVTQEWFKAALNNKIAINNSIKSNHGENVSITGGAWDTKDEVEELGMDDYEKDKGFSTDVYFRLSNGKLHQPSLKKDDRVNFLNSGAGQYSTFMVKGHAENPESPYNEPAKKLLSAMDEVKSIQEELGVQKPRKKDGPEINERWKNAQDIIDSLSNEEWAKIPEEISQKAYGNRQQQRLKNILEEHRDEIKKFDINSIETDEEKIKLQLFKENNIDPKDLEIKGGDYKKLSKEDKERVNNARIQNKILSSEAKETAKENANLKQKANKLMASNNVSWEELIEGLNGDKLNRDGRKLVHLAAIAQGIENHKEEVQKEHRNFITNAVKQINENEAIRDGMLQELKNNFPIRDVAEGKEVMAIGDLSLDTKTISDIFGTTDFEVIKTGFKVETDENGAPYLGWMGKADKGPLLPIASINVREDGVGYGSIIKHEMVLHPDFAKRLRQANAYQYGAGSGNTYSENKMQEEEKQFTEADYLEMLKLSRNSEFADSMVYYKGKVLGRCPKGTIKTGKTCVPGTDAQKFTKYKPGDLGGVSNKQIKKLSKAKTIDDIIKAHKEENEQND